MADGSEPCGPKSGWVNLELVGCWVTGLPAAAGLLGVVAQETANSAVAATARTTTRRIFRVLLEQRAMLSNFGERGVNEVCQTPPLLGVDSEETDEGWRYSFPRIAMRKATSPRRARKGHQHGCARGRDGGRRKRSPRCSGGSAPSVPSGSAADVACCNP